MQASGKHRAISVLVVDDEEDIAYSLSKGLISKGYAVDAYINSVQALTCDPKKYDIAILDIRMPDVNGFELARKLMLKNPDLQVCFFTAFDISPNEARTVLPSLITHCFLKKPMSIEKMASHIEAHFVKA